MKLLIAISSCSKFESNGWNNALRDTWLVDAKNLGVDYKFFSGTGSKECDDTVVLPVDDSYYGLIAKTREKYRWTVNNGYDLVFHCYHDTYACVERLLSCGADRSDYLGDFYHEDPRQPWPHVSHGQHCQSGAGAFLSKKALTYAVQEFPLLEAQNPGIWEEDLWTGRIIRGHEELVICDTRFMTCNLTTNDLGPRRDNEIISCHLSTIYPHGQKWDGNGRETEWKYRPEYMHKLHREWQDSCR
jgi:hypothetical protein